RSAARASFGWSGGSCDYRARLEIQSQGEVMAEEVSRRRFLGVGSAALAAVAGRKIAEGQEKKVPLSPYHHLPNESEPGSNNTVLDKQNPSSVWPPETDSGGQPPFKYSFSLAHKRIEEGGWTRPGRVRDRPSS